MPGSIDGDSELRNDITLAGLLSWPVEFSFAWAILTTTVSGTKRSVMATGSATGGSLSYGIAVEIVEAASRLVS